MAVDLFGNRLLVIDDEPAIGAIIKRLAHSCGFEAIVTEDSDTFMKTARLWEPTVIILDLKMPDVDGVQLLRNLAADKCVAKIMVVSGVDTKVMEAAIALGRDRGLDMVPGLQKPLRGEELRDRLLALKSGSSLQLGADLSRAIGTDQLFLEYQPKLNCRTGNITGVEALVRWKHPTEGMIAPERCIALAVEAGLVNRLTDRVMADAAVQAGRWLEAGRPLDVAVNISARDVEEIDLPDRLARHCVSAGIDPAMITLELTETSVMREAVHMIEVLTRLRLKGFRLSIDDFGTGYSSLAQLQRMPFSEIKIDQAFIGPMMSSDGARAIVEIVIQLAAKLGLSSVAEGVESEATLVALTELGCTTAQGFHISPPVAAQQIAQFKTADQRKRDARTP